MSFHSKVAAQENSNLMAQGQRERPTVCLDVSEKQRENEEYMTNLALTALSARFLTSTFFSSV